MARSLAPPGSPRLRSTYEINGRVWKARWINVKSYCAETDYNTRTISISAFRLRYYPDRDARGRRVWKRRPAWDYPRYFYSTLAHEILHAMWEKAKDADDEHAIWEVTHDNLANASARVMRIIQSGKDDWRRGS